MHKCRYYLTLFIAAVSASSSLLANEYEWNRNADIVGRVKHTVVHKNDTLYDIGMAHGIGFNEMRNANPNLDSWLPAHGREAIIPSEFILPSIREGVVVNLDEYRLYFFPGDKSKVITYPIGIGKNSTPSPEVTTRVKLKIEAPNWYPSKSVRKEYYEEYGKELPNVVYPGPFNPLGPFAIQLDLPEYFIHGTNKRFGIGTKISRGCIRLDNDDLSKFVWQVPKYTAVRFVKEPIKVGVKGKDVFVEFHFDKNENGEGDKILDEVISRVDKIEKSLGQIKIDFLALRDAMKNASGLPQKIGTRKNRYTKK